MKLLLVFMSVVALSAAYSTEHDDLDIEGLIKSKDGLKSYYECFVDLGDCDEVQSSFKKDLPDAVKEACASCNPTQKHILHRFLTELKKLSEEYEHFKKTVDPHGKYFDALEAAVADS